MSGHQRARAFSEALSEAMDRRGLGQRSLSRVARVSQATLSRILRQDSVPSAEHFRSIVVHVAPKYAGQSAGLGVELRRAYHEALAERVWLQLMSREVSPIREVFEIPEARVSFRSMLIEQSACDMRRAIDVCERHMGKRSVRRRLNTLPGWRTMNEVLAFLRSPGVIGQVDLGRIADFFTFAKTLSEGRRLIFPSAATTSYAGVEEAAADLLSVVDECGPIESGLVENVLLYYGTLESALKGLRGLVNGNGQGIVEPYIEVMRQAHAALAACARDRKFPT